MNHKTKRKFRFLLPVVMAAVLCFSTVICAEELTDTTAAAETEEAAETASAAETGEASETAENETAEAAASPAAGLYDLTASQGWPAAPEVSAASVFMFETDTGTVLYSKDPDAVSFPASTTKIMTALLTLENCSLDEEVTFSHDAIYDIEEGGHHYEFEEGEVLTVDECLQFLMVESVNEVGYALAEHIAGSVSEFADMMNKRAKELGCTNTNFVNPHGLNDPEHVTTARDMALILAACVENEDFIRYSSQTSVRLAGRAIRTEGFSTYTNHHLMLQPESEYYDPDVVCGKTGFTSLAGNTLVTYAEKDGMNVVCVLMQGLSDRFNDTRLLLDYAFGDFKVVTQENVTEVFPEAYADTEFPAESLEMPELKLIVPDMTGDEALYTVYEASGTEPTEEDTTVGTMTFYCGDENELGKAGVKLTEDAYFEYADKKAEESLAALESADAGAGEVPAVEKEIFGWTLGELIFLAVMFGLLVILIALLFYLISQRIRWSRSKKRRERYRRR